MRFAFDDDQLAFRDAVRDVLTDKCTTTAIRNSDRAAWDALLDMGVSGVLVPESHGGMGLDERWLVLILEEAGYAGLPQPIVETAAVAMPLVADQVGTSATVTTDLGTPVIPYARESDHLLLADGSDTMVLLAQADVVIDELRSFDERRHGGRAAWDAKNATSVAGDRDLSFDRGAWGTAAMMVGLSQRMLDMTVEYVKEREQFGVQIGSFQAVKHHLADAAMWLTFARATVHRASWSLATDDADRGRDVSLAKSMASDTCDLVARKALQCHGAIGYTEEADLQLFLKRAWASNRTWGDAAWHRDRIGRALDV